MSSKHILPNPEMTLMHDEMTLMLDDMTLTLTHLVCEYNLVTIILRTIAGITTKALPSSEGLGDRASIQRMKMGLHSTMWGYTVLSTNSDANHAAFRTMVQEAWYAAQRRNVPTSEWPSVTMSEGACLPYYFNGSMSTVSCTVL